MAKTITTEDYKGENRRKSLDMNGWKFAQFLFNLIVAVMMAIGTWHINITMDLLEKHAELEKDMAIMKGNRFTSGDASEMKSEFLVAINNLSENVHQMAINMAKLPREIPPEWWVGQVNNRFKQQEKMIDELYDYHKGKGK
ncbi:hypothetical protein ACFL3D_01855 [Candidatus Omnitrophota bacterium]